MEAESVKWRLPLKGGVVDRASGVGRFEFLNAMIESVDDVQISLRVEGETVRSVELARIVARHAE